MSDIYEIKSAAGAYKIEVGPDLIEKVAKQHAHAIYIVDQKLVGRLPASIDKRLVIEAVEENKALENTAQYIVQLRQLGANRDTHLVAIGGGIIQDIVTFIASIYMRGLSWTYLPTTVLSMVDSCIGGKSSINVLGLKNLVGNFYPPQDIFIDPEFISTLDTDMIVGGLFESAKICYAKGPECFKQYLALKPSAHVLPQDMPPIIGLALTTKKWFIEIDEFDQAERLLLNFGHTFGHAIEAATNFEVHHGIGVGVGMLAACEFSASRFPLNAEGSAAVALLRKHIMQMLLSDAGEPLVAPDAIDLNKTLEKFEHDKKHRTSAYRVVVPVEDGRLELVSLARDASTQAEIRQAYKTAFSHIKWSCH
jgi:3-dehydroquinate synthase